MTLQLGDTGKVAFGNLKTFNITLATPRETILGSPIGSLPTSNPGTPQITYTIQTSDLPSITPSPLGVQYTALLIVGGKNTDAAAQTINYQCYKNGSIVTGGNGLQSVPSWQFWTQSHYRFLGVQVGDVLGVSLWCTNANMNYDYYALSIHPTQMNLGKSYINKDVNFSNYIAPSLSSGVPSRRVTDYLYIFPSNSTTKSITPNGNVNFGTLSWNSSYFLGKIGYGDFNIGTDVVSHASNRPYYSMNTVPTTISFREILR